MKIIEIIEKFSRLGIYEKREVGDNYIELVFYNTEIAEWNKIFTDILDPAIKPAGVKPNKDVQNLTEDFGGIYEEQTLYKKEFENTTIIAMFWPWQNDVNTTLKVIALH